MPLGGYRVVTVPSWSLWVWKIHFMLSHFSFILITFEHLVSQRSVLLSSLLSLSLCRNREFLVDLVTYMTFGHCRMKYLNGVRLLIVLSSAHVMGGIWVHRCELCIVMLFLQGTYARVRGKPTYRCSSLLLVSLHVGTHPTISSLQAAEFLQSLGTQMPLQVFDQCFTPQNLRVCNGLLILFSSLFW